MARAIQCLVTAGPTREFFDPVRFLSNPSSGKMGYALAEAARDLGWEVNLISGPVELETPEGVVTDQVVTGEEMYEAVSRRFDQCDVLIMTAAIMDYCPKWKADHKIKKDQLEMVIEMEPVIDVLKTVCERKREQFVVGFAAETDHVETYALKKLANKGADLIVANQIGVAGKGFQSAMNEVMIYGHGGFRRSISLRTKEAIAKEIVQLVAERLESRSND